MNHNVGTADRIVRVVLGLGAIAWAGSVGWSSTTAVVLLVLGAVLIGTAALGFCPLYRLLGISTHRADGTATPSSSRADHLARH
jgi:hypothetical protein